MNKTRVCVVKIRLTLSNYEVCVVRRLSLAVESTLPASDSKQNANEFMLYALSKKENELHANCLLNYTEGPPSTSAFSKAHWSATRWAQMIGLSQPFSPLNFIDLHLRR